MNQWSRRDVLQHAAVTAAALAAQACGKATPSSGEDAHAAYSAAVGSSVDVDVSETVAGRLTVLEVSPRRTLVAPGVGTFDSYSVLFAGPPLVTEPHEPVRMSGAGLGRQTISMLRVDRPMADGRVLYEAIFSSRMNG